MVNATIVIIVNMKGEKGMLNKIDCIRNEIFAQGGNIYKEELTSELIYTVYYFKNDMDNIDLPLYRKIVAIRYCDLTTEIEKIFKEEEI